MIGHTYLSRKIAAYVQITIVVGGLMLMLGACAVNRAAPTGAKIGPTGPALVAPDYEQKNAWAAHPIFYDFSDSIPKPLKPLITDTTVDVFFIHPTSYLNQKSIDETRLADPAEQIRWNAAIDDSVVNRATDKGSILNQASAFNAYRVFAPRYRQAHIRSFYIDKAIAKPFFDTAYADVKNAFLYYLENENKGRPFIIASHSQGTLHAGRLIKELVEGKPLQQQLVAAYLLGLPIADTFFTRIKPCATPGETNCFVSWRTFKKGYEPPAVQKETFKAIVTNPLTWTSEQGWVSRKQNKGALLYKFNKPMPENVGAEVHGNILWSSKPRFFGNIFFTRKNYHIGDINLFWMNIRENAGVRVLEYMNNGIHE
jgi:hypothetical protein